MSTLLLHEQDTYAILGACGEESVYRGPKRPSRPRSSVMPTNIPWFLWAIAAAILWGLNYALTEKLLKTFSTATVLLSAALGGLVMAILMGLSGGGFRRAGARSILLDPPLDVPLGCNAECQRAGGNVLADHRAGTGLGAVSNRNGRDEHVVRAAVHLIADHRAVLGDVVVVGEIGRAHV